MKMSNKRYQFRKGKHVAFWSKYTNSFKTGVVSKIENGVMYVVQDGTKDNTQCKVRECNRKLYEY